MRRHGEVGREPAPVPSTVGETDGSCKECVGNKPEGVELEAERMDFRFNVGGHIALF